jgi:hypothetical protein
MAQGNQILLNVASQMATKALMMNFEMCSATAKLAFPSITLQNRAV